jgi:hypothetical protein
MHRGVNLDELHTLENKALSTMHKRGFENFFFHK